MAARTSLRTSPRSLNVSFSPSSASSPWSYLRCATWVPTLGPRSISPSFFRVVSASRMVLRETKNSAASPVSAGRPLGIGAGVDLLAQHVGDPAGTIGAGSP